MSIVNEFDESESLYSVNCQISTLFLLLLAGADTVLNPPESFSLSIGGCNKPMFEREKLDF